MAQLPTNLSTEAVDPRFADLDTKQIPELARIMNRADGEVAGAVEQALPQIISALGAISDRFNQGGRLLCFGAGTSGRLGVLDASECPPTFNTEPGRVVGVIAGGNHAFRSSTEAAEDSDAQGASDVALLEVEPRDAVVGIAASGRTPYVLGVLREARDRGALTVALSCNPDAAASKLADHPIEVVSGPEFVAGSTRLRAGTATKLVLNMMSTITMIRAGKVYGNRMVDVQTSNEKLKIRAARMVAELADVDVETASSALAQNEWSAKQTVLALLSDLSPQEAAQRLAAAGGHLRKALAGQ